MRPRPHLLLAVAVGGAVGALLRHALGEAVPDGDGVAWTTSAVNVLGSFLLALAPLVAAVRRSDVVAAAVGPGVLGGFTTMSAHAEQVRALAADGRAGPALVSLLGTLAACLVAVLAASALVRARERGRAT